MSRSKPNPDSDLVVEYADWSGMLPVITQVAFVLSLGLVIGRMTFMETLREPFEAAPGVALPPRGAGAATAVVLNLLCCLPAMLILLRRVIDKTYVLRFSITHALFLAMALLAVFSTFWSSDRFAAAVGSTNLVAAAAMLWSGTQLVRSWARLRLVAGVCFGVLLVLTAHGMIYRLVDLPDTQKAWTEQRDQFMRARGWTADSFALQQFEKNLQSGAILGFSASPNTYAAILVFLGIISAGVVVQRFADRDEFGWGFAVIATLPFVAFALWYTRSRAALATPVIAALMLAVIARFGTSLLRRRKQLFWSAIGTIVLATGALIAHGLYHGTLFHNSLTFRWKYWVGSMRMVREHLALGVGWGNFGPSYLPVRLAEASEEIKDPHNMLVRVLCELGIAGLVILVAFLVRGAWDATRAAAPIPPREQAGRKPDSRQALLMLTSIALVGMLVNACCSIDFSQSADYVLLELLRRLLYFGLLLLGGAVVTLRSKDRAELDSRACPWVLTAMLAALAVLLVHNMIDFSIFENGPLVLFASVFGSVLGVRAPSSAGRPRRSAAVVACTTATVLLAAIAVVGFVIPLVDAEAKARQADAAISSEPPKFNLAAALLKDAFDNAPVRNSDYALRSAKAFMFVPGADAQTLGMLASAIESNGMDPSAPLTRARYQSRRNLPADRSQVLADYARALSLNPMDVETRIEFAEALVRDGNRPAAAAELRKALEIDGKLDPDNPKRLSPSRRLQVEAMATSL